MSQHIIIIGGMGPQASHELHGRLIAAASDRGAREGDDYPQITHISLPIADFISNRDAGQAAETINRNVRRLYKWQS